MLFIKGIGALILTLAAFSIFSLKCPKGSKAMSGLAGAAIATFLVEAVCTYIFGDLAGIEFFKTVGASAGSMAGPAAAVLVGINMGTPAALAVASGMALKDVGILPGFLAGYALHFILKPIMKYLPDGVNEIVGALTAAAGGCAIAMALDPGVSFVIGTVGDAIIVAAEQSPLLMGMLLGGVIKMVCTSPLSSMALTAMLNLTGLPMGIAAIACFGGTFTNGVIFWRLRLGNGGHIAAVMLEPLTQADIITRNPIPIYASNFFGGGFSGIAAAALGIICNAPGTASPIPGMLVPFAFNPAGKVLAALAIAAVCGTVSGFAGAGVFKRLYDKGVRLYTPMEQAAE